MNNIPQTRIPTGGVDRTNLPHVTDPKNWWTLNNLRPVNGGLEQTPPLCNKMALNVPYPGTDIRLLEHVAIDGQLQLLIGNETEFVMFDEVLWQRTPVLYLELIKMPITATTTTLCQIDSGGSSQHEEAYISGSNIDIDIALATATSNELSQQALLYGDLAHRFVADLDTFWLEILTSTTARWRFISKGITPGAWYEFTIAKTVVIDPVLNINLAFMNTTDFAPGDYWQWIVTSPVIPADNECITTSSYGNDLYIAGYDRRILRFRDGIVTGVGYKPAFGKRTAVFYNHLVIAQYEEAAVDDGHEPLDPYDVRTTPWRLAWSHLNDPDQLFPTDLNEADVYDFPATSAAYRGYLGITNLAILNETLIIYLANSMYSMRYVGLPTVMQITPLVNNIGSIFYDGLVITSEGHFFIGIDNIYFFDGTKPIPMGFEVCEQFFTEIGTPSNNPRYDWTYAKYDQRRSEVIWTYWSVFATGKYVCRQLIYQVDFKRFYFRNMPSDSMGTYSGNTYNIRTFVPELDSTVPGTMLYGAKTRLLHEYEYGVDSLRFLANDTLVYSGATIIPALTLPYAETPDLSYGDLYSVKEHSSFLLDAAYDIGSGVTVSHNARNAVGNPLAVTLTPLTKVWTTSLAERILSFPRKDGVVFRYGFTGTYTTTVDPISGYTVTVPTIGLKITGYADFIYTGKAEQ